MDLIKKVNWKGLKHEYGLDGQRLLPWENANFPFGGAYCVVKSNTNSLQHVNQPDDEDEFFIVISGKAKVFIDGDFFEIEKGDQVFIPKGTSHYVENTYNEDFHFYALWWNSESIGNHINQNNQIFNHG